MIFHADSLEVKSNSVGKATPGRGDIRALKIPRVMRTRWQLSVPVSSVAWIHQESASRLLSFFFPPFVSAIPVGFSNITPWINDSGLVPSPDEVFEIHIVRTNRKTLPVRWNSNRRPRISKLERRINVVEFTTSATIRRVFFAEYLPRNKST